MEVWLYLQGTVHENYVRNTGAVCQTKKYGCAWLYIFVPPEIKAALARSMAEYLITFGIFERTHV